MGQGLTLKSQYDENAGSVGSLSTEDARDFFEKAPPLLVVRGIEPVTGESWKAYNQRVGSLLQDRFSATVSAPPSPSRPETVCISKLEQLIVLGLIAIAFVIVWFGLLL
jgi:hypothetical protein